MKRQKLTEMQKLGLAYFECENPEYYRKLGYTEVTQQELIPDEKRRIQKARALASMAVTQPRLF